MLALIEQYFWILFISMVPLIELRGAIPVGVAMGNLPLLGIYIAAIIGNMLPVPIILLFAKKVLIWCTKLPYVGKCMDRLPCRNLVGYENLAQRFGGARRRTYRRPYYGRAFAWRVWRAGDIAGLSNSCAAFSFNV